MITDTKQIKYFTAEELDRLFKAIKNTNNRFKIRNEAIFRIGYYCALRATEIGLIRIDDYNTSRNELYCRRLKGSNNNTIRIIDTDTLRALKKYIREYNPEDIMFPSQKGGPISRKMLDKLIKQYCDIANIKDITKHHFHTLKHTRAVILAEESLDVKDIQYWLGHKEISNTQIYFQFTSSQYDSLYKKLSKFEQ